MGFDKLYEKTSLSIRTTKYVCQGWGYGLF